MTLGIWIVVEEWFRNAFPHVGTAYKDILVSKTVFI